MSYACTKSTKLHSQVLVSNNPLYPTPPLIFFNSYSLSGTGKTERGMLLIQLSDLHIGGTYFKQEIFDNIVYEVKNKLKPDVILITGDLTDEGLRPWLWNLETMDIVYAGTASSTRFRGFTKNTYNILDIRSNGKVIIDLKIVGGKRIPLVNITRK